MQFHEVANLFPLMTESEMELLVEDIKNNGQRQDILIDKDGKIIDGRNRWFACEKLGIAAQTKTWDGRGSLISLSISLNLSRRHLNSSQRAVLALQILPLLEDDAKQRQRASGGDRKSEAYKKTLTAKNEEPKNYTGEAVEFASKLVGSNRDYLYTAKKLEKQSPNLLNYIKNGEINIREAKLICTLEGEELQQKVIDKIKEGIDVRVARAKVIKDATAIPEFPKGKYRVIYADPPWGNNGNPLPDRISQASDIYPTMEIDEICSMPVKDIADDNAVLFLWVVSFHLPNAFKIFESWGFTYKSSIIWHKKHSHWGYYTNISHEILLIATRGSCTPECEKLFNSVASIKRTRHSEKPNHFREMIDTMYPTGNRIELFARKKYKKWEAYGNQIEEVVND